MYSCVLFLKQFSHAKEPEKLSQALLSFEEKMKPTRYKFGILYMRENQTEEDDIYGNLDPSEEFISFLKVMSSLRLLFSTIQSHASFSFSVWATLSSSRTTRGTVVDLTAVAPIRRANCLATRPCFLPTARLCLEDVGTVLSLSDCD